MLLSDPVADRVAFARRVLGIKPFSYQEDALRSTAPFVVIAGGRRSGKTLIAQVWALHTCFVHGGARVLVTSANEDSALRVLAEIAELLRESKIAQSAVLDLTKGRIDFANGSAIIALPPTAGQLRGHGRNVRGVLIDEAGHCPAGVWRDARYVLLDHHDEGAQAFIVGSPWGGGFFEESHRRGTDGDDDFDSFTWRTEDNPRLPKGYVAKERARLPVFEAAVELDGMFAGKGLSPWEAIVDAIAAPFSTYSLAQLVGPARGLLGADWAAGVGADRSAAAVIMRLLYTPWNGGHPAESPPIFVLCTLEMFGERERLTSVVEKIAATRAHFDVVSPETNGVGAMASDELIRALGNRKLDVDPDSFVPHRINPTATTAAKKALGYGTLLNLAESGRLVIPNDPALKAQLRGLTYERSQGGHTRIEASNPTVHDDLTDAMYLASCVYSNRQRRGELVCALAHAAHMNTPEAFIGDTEVETVTTGAGLVVPRRPWLQSVFGDEVTSPRRAEQAAPTVAHVHPLIAKARARIASADRKESP